MIDELHESKHYFINYCNPYKIKPFPKMEITDKKKKLIKTPLLIPTTLLLEDSAFLPVSFHYPCSNRVRAVHSLLPGCMWRQRSYSKPSPVLRMFLHPLLASVSSSHTVSGSSLRKMCHFCSYEVEFYFF